MSLRPIFYDTETTGTRSDKDRIIEIAAYDPTQDRTFERFVNPLMPIPPEATNIHHITDEMVQDSPDWSVIGEEFIQFCKGAVVLIAHNNDQFDLHFLKAEYERHHITMPSWNFMDTLKWARRYRPDLPNHKLQSLREIYGIEANNAHRALDDVIILHKVYTIMTDDLKTEEIMALINKPRSIQHMPFGKYQGKPIKSVPKDYVKWLAGSGAFDKPENAPLKEAFELAGTL